MRPDQVSDGCHLEVHSWRSSLYRSCCIRRWLVVSVFPSSTPPPHSSFLFCTCGHVIDDWIVPIDLLLWMQAHLSAVSIIQKLRKNGQVCVERETREICFSTHLKSSDRHIHGWRLKPPATLCSDFTGKNYTLQSKNIHRYQHTV